MDTHVRVAAWLRLIWSALGLIPALLFLLLFGGIGVVGSIIGGAPVAVPFIMVFFSFLALIFAITALPGLVTGWGLLAYQPWARILNIVLSAIDLFNFPVGTALGVYSIWVMVQPETVALFEGDRVPGRYPTHF
jgi:hypothetical protein